MVGKSGFYPESRVVGIPDAYLERFFERKKQRLSGARRNHEDDPFRLSQPEKRFGPEKHRYIVLPERSYLL
jgi:hypothetical protein